MTLKEEKRDLFTVPNDYYLAHCISDDFALGAGVAVEFNKRYDMVAKLRQEWPEGLWGSGCITIDNVFNLVTKQYYWHKPSYSTLQRALESMLKECEKLGVTKIAIPRIGCGLDGLQWGRVKDIVWDVFEGTDIEILVCRL